MNKEQLYSHLIENYKNSIERTRRAFIALNIVTIIFLIGYFNYRWTWLRHLSTEHRTEYIMNLKENTLSRPDNYLELADPGDPYNKIDIRRKMIEENLGDKFKFINIDLIGSRIFIDDLPILGGITIMVMLTWFFYVIRREKGIAHEVKRRISGESDVNSIRYLFYGTSFNEIFNSIRTIDYNGDSDLNKIGNNILKGIRRLMLFAPTIILFLIVSHDFKETFFTVKFDDMKFTLWDYLVHHKQGGQLAEIVIRLIFSCIFILFGIIMTFGILSVNRKIGSYMEEIETKYLQQE
jgi:hypothetical protein